MRTRSKLRVAKHGSPATWPPSLWCLLRDGHLTVLGLESASKSHISSKFEGPLRVLLLIIFSRFLLTRRKPLVSVEIDGL